MKKPNLVTPLISIGKTDREKIILKVFDEELKDMCSREGRETMEYIHGLHLLEARIRSSLSFYGLE